MVGIASPAADESGLNRGPGLRGRPADQLDQAEDHQQDDDKYDDEQPGGMAPEDEDQRDEGHRPDPEALTVRVRPLADRTGGHSRGARRSYGATPARTSGPNGSGSPRARVR